MDVARFQEGPLPGKPPRCQPQAALNLGNSVWKLLATDPNVLELYVPGIINIETHKLQLLDSKPHNGWKSYRYAQHLNSAFEHKWGERLLRDYQYLKREELTHMVWGATGSAAYLCGLWRRKDLAWCEVRMGWPLESFATRTAKLFRMKLGMANSDLAAFRCASTSRDMRGRLLSRRCSKQDRECFVCKQFMTTVFKCGGCGAIWYCSRACQKEHWKQQHRLFCKQLAGRYAIPAEYAYRLGDV